MMAAHDLQKVSLHFLLEEVDVIGPLPNLDVTAITIDSREVRPGGLFLACAGIRSHGLEYLQQAEAMGAAAVIAEISSDWLPEKITRVAKQVRIPVLSANGLTGMASHIAGRFYAHPSRQFPVIGITGTNGKTSCCQFIARAFAGRRKVAVMGTLGNGFPGELSPSTHTTQDAVSVQALLSGMQSARAEMVAMEVSSHALSQGRVSDINFDMAVLTNFSRDHLDYHGTMSAYAGAKSLLFKMPGLKSALVNANDELGLRLIDELAASPVRVIAYGTDIDSTDIEHWISARDIEALPHGLGFTVESSWGEACVTLSLIGKFNVLNALVALGVMLECGISFDDAITGLSALTTVEGRMQQLASPGLPSVVVDFAHTPDALQQVLESLHEHVRGKLVCVFGCGGDRDRGKRPEMGRIAERYADRVILTDDNPRHEDPELIVAQILQGMQEPQQVTVEHNRATAIEKSIREASEKDVVLVAGKGHEKYQQVGDLKLSFSDQQAVLSVLEAL